MTSITFFRTPEAFRRWLAKHHASASELVVGFHTRGSGKPSVTWSEAVDEALCVGWIDGIRRSVDAGAYSIRFTPRRPGSTWSPTNLAKVKRLIRQGRMRKAGRAVYEARKPARRVYAYDRRPVRLPSAFLARLRSQPKASEYFSSRPPSYRNTAIFWVVSAARPATRKRRMDHLIARSAAGKPITPLSYGRGTVARTTSTPS
jgi:uncharacterized protein YdeI (YjbR/CyaY-like superfamily)